MVLVFFQILEDIKYLYKSCPPKQVKWCKIIGFLNKQMIFLAGITIEEICKFVTLQIEISFISKNKKNCESEAKKK